MLYYSSVIRLQTFYMSENLLRFLISLVGTLICMLVFIAGYVSGTHGWWWAAIGVLFVYAIINSLLHHH